MQDATHVSLDELAGGALRQRFGQALAEVLANIDDPNTDGKPREISIKVVLEPSKDRAQLGVGFTVTAKPRARDEVQTVLFIDRRGPDSFRVSEHQAARPSLTLTTDRKGA